MVRFNPEKRHKKNQQELFTKTHTEMKQKTSKQISYEESLEMQREIEYRDWCYFGADSGPKKPVEVPPILLLKQLRDALRELGV